MRKCGPTSFLLCWVCVRSCPWCGSSATRVEAGSTNARRKKGIKRGNTSRCIELSAKERMLDRPQCVFVRQGKHVTILHDPSFRGVQVVGIFRDM